MLTEELHCGNAGEHDLCGVIRTLRDPAEGERTGDIGLRGITVIDTDGDLIVLLRRPGLVDR